MDKVLIELKDTAMNDIREFMAQKGKLDPCDYGPVGDAVDIVKDVYKIYQMEMEMGIADEGEEMWEESRSRMSGVPARSPRTGRFVSRDSMPNNSMRPSYGEWEAYGSTYPYRHEPSYHDHDGSIKKDLDELMANAKSDHERMLLMRVQSKIDQQK